MILSTSLEDTSINARQCTTIEVITDDPVDAVLLVINGVVKRPLKLATGKTYRGTIYALECDEGGNVIEIDAYYHAGDTAETDNVGILTVGSSLYINPADMVRYLIEANWDSLIYGAMPEIIKQYERKGFDPEWEGNFIVMTQGKVQRTYHAQRNYYTEVSPIDLQIRVSQASTPYEDDDHMYARAEDRAFQIWRGVIATLEAVWNTMPDRLWNYMAIDDSGENDSDEMNGIFTIYISTALVDEWRKVGGC
jgi:hypothetical protein